MPFLRAVTSFIYIYIVFVKFDNFDCPKSKCGLCNASSTALIRSQIYYLQNECPFCIRVCRDEGEAERSRVSLHPDTERTLI